MVSQPTRRKSSVSALIAGAVLSAAAALVPSSKAQAGGFSSYDVTAAFTPPAATSVDAAPAADKSSDAAVDTSQPKYLDAAPASPQIHGFFDSPFKTAYITPRGLVVENQGLVWQPVVGLVFPLPPVFGIKDLSAVAGIWNSVNTHQNDTNVGAWNEMDVFVGFGGHITKEIKIDFDYEAWNFPQSTVAKPSTEHNLQLKISYDDSALWGKSGFALNPYVNFFYEVGGSSTVVLGKNGSTGYAELGLVPTYTWKGMSTPVTFTFPTYISVGDEKYWGRGDSALTKPDGNWGVFSTSVNVTVPLSFIPIQYGNWHAEAGVIYYHLINDALLRAGTLLSGNTERDVFNAYVGVGVGF